MARLFGYSANDHEILYRAEQQARRFPILEEQEEYNLASRFLETGCEVAKAKIVSSHLRIVVKAACDHQNYKVPMVELLSVGNFALADALRRFNPEEARFSTFATTPVTMAMKNYARKAAGVTNSEGQKKVFFNLPRLRREMRIDSEELSPEQVKKIATKLKVKERDVAIVNDTLNQRQVSIDDPLFPDDPDRGNIQFFLVDRSDNQEIQIGDREERTLLVSFVKEAMTNLSDRERDILACRRLKEEPDTLEDLSQKYGISRERVRQIEVRAFEKVQNLALQLKAEHESECVSRAYMYGFRPNSSTAAPSP